jgi:two-component system phosphate regulon sensor histidine kinase PhoR
MRRRRLFWRVYATYLFVIVLCVAALAALVYTAVEDFYYARTQSELEARAALVREEIVALLAEERRAELQETVDRLAAASRTRLTVISAGIPEAPLGLVLAESDADPDDMGDHSDRPEFRAALRGTTGHAVRISATTEVEEMYVAVPVEQEGRVVAAVRAATAVDTIEDALPGLYWRIALSAILVAMAAALVGLLVSGRISRQMLLLREGAERFAGGDLAHKIQVPRTEEFVAVAESLNSMAEQLDREIGTLTRERNEREAVLASMVEGVIAVDTDERVLTINEAAARLLNVDLDAAVGHTIQEVVRNPELHHVVAETLAGNDPVERELAVRAGPQQRTLQASGTLLRGGGDERPVGAVVVLNDVSRMKRLETVRRDFVANVSHELKTPVTSIKGFAETLLDPQTANDTDTRDRFLRIIALQADRLNAIIGDLLALSTLEADDTQGTTLEEADVCDVVHVAAEVCGIEARAKGIPLVVKCPDSTSARINPPLLEQAVVNLIDNAVKYSPAGGPVLVTVEERPHEIVILVRDEGPGIAREHLPRLFERFYRVDRARSRDLGGTGLGLAIVKHVAQLHGGRVSISSDVGRGSTFRLHLPHD